MSSFYGKTDTTRKCGDCGCNTEYWDSCHDRPICPFCQDQRECAYDDYVDPIHWYHQHDPERICEP